ncbi:RNA polymerase sigma factor [Dyadobacter jiangsuensis]|uniref:RNA polymerase sigma-70 factor (ECF subfamily) n=1 Tax=Dyadobacter jiangsuensis TaxID=1591085 RepID=A0A2P8FCR2_9BACT|nr:sigma-70 family RNA polymerase sigma factor [Dyadobacter jiangsuensis]PSL19509.1 RNA polymerase sigma-70 factor (ECF subfamily) [Dyadobacter jiangsuensis]
MIRNLNQDNSDDQVLLNRMRLGDYLAFGSIYERYWARLFNAAYKRTGDEDSAKDITQDIFLQLWQRRQELEIDNLPAYLLTSVRNNVFKYMEKQQRYIPISELVEQLLSSGEYTDGQLATTELMARFTTLLERLTPSQQEIFRLRFEEEMGTMDIARRLNIAQKTVQNQLTRSVAQIRQAIGLIAIMIAGCP